MRRHPTLALLLLLVLCTQPLSAAENDSERTEPVTQAPSSDAVWVGKSVEELKASWGGPTKVKRRGDGGRLLVYKVELVDGVMLAPGTSFLVAPTPHDTSAVGGGQPRSDGLPFNAPDAVYMTTPDSAGARVIKKAKAKFVVDRGGVVVEARLPRVPR